jgi:ribosomal protein L21E
MQEFKVGDVVTIKQEYLDTLKHKVGITDCWWPFRRMICDGKTGTVINVDSGLVLLKTNPYRWLHTEYLEVVTKTHLSEDKQISIERVGDKTSVTISGHLTKDDVQSILNLIFLEKT